MFFRVSFLGFKIANPGFDPKLFDPDSDPPNLKWSGYGSEGYFINFNTIYFQVRTCFILSGAKGGDCRF